MIVELEYGEDKLKVEINKKNLLHIITSKPLKALENPRQSLIQNIRNPIGSIPISAKVKGKKKVCIVISDSTRAVPTKLILEALLAELAESGIPKEFITILIATGLHRPNLGDELVRLVGRDILDYYKQYSHLETMKP